VSRKYDASRRIALAEKTREAILEAAFRLHGQGIFDMERLAKEADVSVATVRKHFPTRELLFEGCTAFGMHLVPMPDLGAIAAIEDPADRAREAVRQVYALHEALLGQVWNGFKLEDESPSLAAVIQQIASIVGAAAQIVSAAWPARAGGGDAFHGFVSGMLSPLTYRALRIQAGLSPGDATSQVAEALVRAGESAPGAEEGAAAYR
jgi:AcrR family transcriptional regulator